MLDLGVLGLGLLALGLCKCVWSVRELAVGKRIMHRCTIHVCGCEDPISEGKPGYEF